MTQPQQPSLPLPTAQQLYHVATTDLADPYSESAQAKMEIWLDDPVQFVKDVFGAEPDEWQADTLRLLVHNPRVAMMACKGPGKTCLEAWAGWWMMVIRVDTQGLVLSVTKDNLRDNLWKEIRKWHSRAPLLERAFHVGATRVESRERPGTWWISARSFPKDADKQKQTSSLAGLHDDSVFIILDEVSEYPPGILPAAEGIFANKDHTFARLLVGGNTTQRGGPLWDICTRDSAMWKVVSITGDPENPKRSPRISIEWAQQQIDAWGRDDAWVMANVLGEFPLVSSDKLLDIAQVDLAMKRDVSEMYYSGAAIIWGLDPAWSPDGDEIALVRRQGLLARRVIPWRGLGSIALARQVAVMLNNAHEHGGFPDLLAIDVGGGGHAVAEELDLLGFSDFVVVVDFGSRPDDPKFENKRAEMLYTAATWVKQPDTCLPNDPTLRAELIAPRCSYEMKGHRTLFCVESKKSMKARGISSPNRADAFALTFALPVAQIGQHKRERRDIDDRAITDYDPYEYM